MPYRSAPTASGNFEDKLKCRGVGQCTPWNRAPVAASAAVISVPYTGRGQGFTTFPVTAYDPDMQAVGTSQMRTDDVMYRFATREEMGSMLSPCLSGSADPDSSLCSTDSLGVLPSDRTLGWCSFNSVCTWDLSLHLQSLAGLEGGDVLGRDNVRYAAKHVRAVFKYCGGSCASCTPCSGMLATEDNFFSCFDCERFPPAYQGVSCSSLPQEIIADYSTDQICAGLDTSTLLLDIVDESRSFFSKLSNFFSEGGDPMARYRSAMASNPPGSGRVRIFAVLTVCAHPLW